MVANISLEVVFQMLFYTLSDADIDVLGRKLQWKTYITKETFPTTRRVKLVEKKEFATAALDLKHETFVIYVASLSFTPLDARLQISSLIAKEAPTKISAQYLNFADIFSLDLASELPKHIGINDHAIELVNGQQPTYGPIYSLGTVELKTLKAYIETNLANSFIKSSKSPAGAPILFDQKSDGFFWLYVNY